MRTMPGPNKRRTGSRGGPKGRRRKGIMGRKAPIKALHQKKRRLRLPPALSKKVKK